MTRQQILDKVADKMVELFDLDRSAIKPEARFEDLELTSIDAIDLVIELQQMTGRRVSEKGFQSVRTVADLVDLVEAHLAAGGEPPRSAPAP